MVFFQNFRRKLVTADTPWCKQLAPILSIQAGAANRPKQRNGETQDELECECVYIYIYIYI